VVSVEATVTFVNEGTNPHRVTADDGSFASGSMAPGDRFSVTFDQPGPHSFYCRYHGAAGGFGMSGTVLAGDAAAVEEAAEVPPPEPGTGRTLVVPEDAPTIQTAVDAARPGDLVLVAPGVYREALRVTTPYLTIRGMDRNEVVLDGGFEHPNGIHVLEAGGVTLENLTARHLPPERFRLDRGWTDTGARTSPRTTTVITACTRSTRSTGSSTTRTPRVIRTPASTSASAIRVTPW
jgi:hypothetical protein